MARSNTISAVLLAATALSGIYCLHVLGSVSLHNHWLHLHPLHVMQSELTFIIQKPQYALPRLRTNGLAALPKWPGTTHPLKRAYTGFKPIDKVLSALNPFFAPVLDGSDPSLSLWGLFMFGQYGASFALAVLESWRYGNKGRAVSLYVLDSALTRYERILICWCESITFFFSLGQLLGWAVAFPIWALTYILTSPLSSPNPIPLQSQNTLIPLHKLSALPYSIFFGYIALSVAPLFTSSPSTRQSLLGIWQPFPIWTYILQQIFQLSTTSSPVSKSNTPLTRLQKTTYIKTLNRTYTFLFLFLATTHVSALALTLNPSLLNPILPSISKALVKHDPSISTVYIPHFPSASSHTPKTLAEAVHVFLWWDVYVASTAGFIWVITLLRGLGKGVGAGTVGKVLIGAALGGPWGGILAAVRERDLKALEGGERVE